MRQISIKRDNVTYMYTNVKRKFPQNMFVYRYISVKGDCHQYNFTTIKFCCMFSKMPPSKGTKEDVRSVNTPWTTKLYGCKQKL